MTNKVRQKNKQKQFTLSYNKFHLREPQFSSSLLSPQSFSWSHFSSAPIQIPLAHVKSLELQVWETVAKKKKKKKKKKNKKKKKKKKKRKKEKKKKKKKKKTVILIRSSARFGIERCFHPTLKIKFKEKQS